MSTERCDVLVVGGGIHGAGVAQAAAAAGYKVLVLEQTALASGTSSRSSKLIHGGLRYLESAQFALVRECLRERALLLKLAPDLVRLRPFYIPVYRHTTRRPWQIRVGLGLYAVLAGLGNDARFRTVPRRTWDTLDGLDTSGLSQVFSYFDAQTDDAALTRAVMQSAVELGADLRCPAKMLKAELHAESCSAHYVYEGSTHSIHTRVLVNAAGPWVNQVLATVTPQPPQYEVDLVQGTHILVPGTLSQGIYYLEAPSDRRAVFAMPWHEHTLVGTTETLYHGDPAAVHPLATEQAYLLDTLRAYFPRYRESTTPVLNAYAGLRVLPSADDTPFGRSRETLLLPDRAQQARVLSIYGGKLTAYRATAQAVMRRLAASLPTAAPVADTTELKLKPVSSI